MALVHIDPSWYQELDLVDALGDMEITQKLIDSDTHYKDADGNPINPLDGHFQDLNLKFMHPIKTDSEEHKTLQEYATSTHGRTHWGVSSHILQAFRVERHEEKERWYNAGYDKLADGERLLLWHGSRSTNFAGILKQGLRIAPPEAPVTGYMFGKGVYFADVSGLLLSHAMITDRSFLGHVQIRELLSLTVSRGSLFFPEPAAHI